MTIFGESAGGESVAMLTIVPAAKGLFQRVISESGGSMSPLKTGDQIDRMVPTLKLAEADGRKFLEKLGAHDLPSARALSAETIQASASTWDNSGPLPTEPFCRAMNTISM